jgi:hypothetical protein
MNCKLVGYETISKIMVRKAESYGALKQINL